MLAGVPRDRNALTRGKQLMGTPIGVARSGHALPYDLDAWADDLAGRWHAAAGGQWSILNWIKLHRRADHLTRDGYLAAKRYAVGRGATIAAHTARRGYPSWRETTPPEPLPTADAPPAEFLAWLGRETLRNAMSHVTNGAGGSIGEIMPIAGAYDEILSKLSEGPPAVPAHAPAHSPELDAQGYPTLEESNREWANEPLVLLIPRPLYTTDVPHDLAIHMEVECRSRSQWQLLHGAEIRRARRILGLILRWMDASDVAAFLWLSRPRFEALVADPGTFPPSAMWRLGELGDALDPAPAGMPLEDAREIVAECRALEAAVDAFYHTAASDEPDADAMPAGRPPGFRPLVSDVSDAERHRLASQITRRWKVRSGVVKVALAGRVAAEQEGRTGAGCPSAKTVKERIVHAALIEALADQLTPQVWRIKNPIGGHAPTPESIVPAHLPSVEAHRAWLEDRTIALAEANVRDSERRTHGPVPRRPGPAPMAVPTRTAAPDGRLTGVEAVADLLAGPPERLARAEKARRRERGWRPKTATDRVPHRKGGEAEQYEGMGSLRRHRDRDGVDCGLDIGGREDERITPGSTHEAAEYRWERNAGWADHTGRGPVADGDDNGDDYTEAYRLAERTVAPGFTDLSAAFAALEQIASTQQREVLALRRQGHKMVEVARRLGVDPGAVRNQWHRLMAKARKAGLTVPSEIRGTG